MDIGSLPYFMDYRSKKIPHRLGPLDAHGVPMVHYRDARGVVYNPVTVIQYGLAHHQGWLTTNDLNAQKIFLKCTRWLVENQHVDLKRDLGAWIYNFDLPEIKIKAPWISGMAQGQALSIFARAWSLAHDEACALAAQRAARAFEYTIEEGGVCAEIMPGLDFFEEVAARPAIHILNGFLYALVGLYEYGETWEPVPALSRGIYTAQAVLDYFDSGYWSRYSMLSSNHLADLHYHHVHIRQLRYLGMVCNVPEFINRAERWEYYAGRPAFRIRQRVTLLIQKIARRLNIDYARPLYRR